MTDKPRRTYWQWFGIGTTLHIGILALLILSVLGYIVFQSTLRQMRYEPVQGTIIKSAAKPCGNGKASVDIRFTYTVDRRVYRQGKYRDVFGPDCQKREKVDAILAQYPRGSTVEAWYDPERPSLAVLDRSVGAFMYRLLIVMGSLAILFAVLILFRYGRARQKATVAGT